MVNGEYRYLKTLKMSNFLHLCSKCEILILQILSLTPFDLKTYNFQRICPSFFQSFFINVLLPMKNRHVLASHYVFKFLWYSLKRLSKQPCRESHCVLVQITVELQWLEHRWLVYHGYFELVFESLETVYMTGDVKIELG